MKSICFANLKGGTGKTATLFNIAGILAEKGKRVLVIDVDPQGNITNNLGIRTDDLENEKREKPKIKTIVDVFESSDKIKPPEVIIKTKINNIFLIPGSIYLTATELQLIQLAGRELILKNFIEDNINFFNKFFDYIFFDTNPSFNIMNQNAFIVADSILLVNDVSRNSILGSEKFCDLWADIRKRLKLQDNVKGLIINHFDKRTKVASELLEYIVEHEKFKDILIPVPIPTTVRIKDGELSIKTINLMDKKSPAYQAYLKVIEELYRRGIL